MSPMLLFGFEAFAWLLVPLVPALIALYFLKLKRREVAVSSTYLWKRSIEDLHVNSPFQRLRKSLLLLLQLLALLAIILATWKPVVTGSGGKGRNLLVLIDNSASMNAREEGGTRLELARREARTLVEGLGERDGKVDRMAVIAFSSRSSVLQPLTADATALRRAIDAVPATSLPTDLLQALRTAEAISKSLAAAEVYVIGDGAYGGLAIVPAELERFALKYIGVGKASENLGITELDVRRSFGARQRLELFASVHNATAAEKQVALGVYLLPAGDSGGGGSGRLLSAAELKVPPGKARSHTFDAGRFAFEGATGPVTLRLEIDPGGLLADDDRAYVRLAPPERLKVLVVGGANPFLDRVLGVQPLIDASRRSLADYRAEAASGRIAADPARVLIFDREAPPEPPDRPALYLGCAPQAPELRPDPLAGAPADPPPPEGAAPAVVKHPLIVDWDRSHPVNRFLVFADLKIDESLGFSAGRAYRSLIDASEKSIAGAVTFRVSGRPPVSAVIVGFDVLKSNWPWLHSFPIFFGNALEWLGTSAGSTSQPRYKTGDVLAFFPGEKQLESPAFRDPRGNDHPAAPERTGGLTFAGTEEGGIYELRAGGQVLENYAVSLLSAPESAIAPLKELRFGSQVISAEAVGPETRDLWKWFALAGLAVVLLEWWVYNRRMYV